MPVVHETAYVDESAQVIGDVEIGQESSVWMNAVVRGDVHRIRIGRRTNIQDGTIVHVMRETHPTVIHDEVTIGHGVIVHGCTILNRVLVGMGAILLNGVEIGSDSIVAAGTLLTEGTTIAAAVARDGKPRQGAPRADRRRSGVDPLVCRQLRAATVSITWRRRADARAHAARARHARLPARGRASARVRHRRGARVYGATASSRSRRRRSRTSRR